MSKMVMNKSEENSFLTPEICRELMLFHSVV